MKQSKTVSGKVNKPVKQKTANTKFETVDQYISALPANTKNIVKELRKTIKQAAPKAEELISYNIPVFKLQGMGLIWYAGWKEHVSIYPKSSAMEASIKEIAVYEGAKGTIKFPIDKPFPFALITKIVKFRIQENLKNAKNK